MQRIVEAMRPEVEAAIERVFGSTLLLLRPTPKRLAAWRTKAQTVAARDAGYAYAAYGHLKVATVTEEIADALFRIEGRGGGKASHERVRQAVVGGGKAEGLADAEAMTRPREPQSDRLPEELRLAYRSAAAPVAPRSRRSRAPSRRARLRPPRGRLQLIGRYSAAPRGPRPDPAEREPPAALARSPTLGSRAGRRGRPAHRGPRRLPKAERGR
jgi:hypothetical protein